MPELCRFFGIIIRMFNNDHNPPHFHVIYGDDEALIDIGTLEVLYGHLPRRALAIVLEWAAIHREMLQQNWELASVGKPPLHMEPLE
ncbi:MAG: DUF4160 domain-containing protein [Magnetococcales bacterium]|nr:DUF4160 domain-containing protein [Magnetococcales bacterium]